MAIGTTSAREENTKFPTRTGTFPTCASRSAVFAIKALRLVLILETSALLVDPTPQASRVARRAPPEVVVIRAKASMSDRRWLREAPVTALGLDPDTTLWSSAKICK